MWFAKSVHLVGPNTASLYDSQSTLRLHVLVTVFVVDNAISITHSACVSVALIIQHAERMHCALLPSVACTAEQYFTTLSHKRHDLEKKLFNTKCVFWCPLPVLSEIVLILRSIERDIIQNAYWSSRRVPVIPVRLEPNLKFLEIFSKKPQKQNFMKFRPVGADMFHADGKTDARDEANILSGIPRTRLEFPVGCVTDLYTNCERKKDICLHNFLVRLQMTRVNLIWSICQPFSHCVVMPRTIRTSIRRGRVIVCMCVCVCMHACVRCTNVLVTTVVITTNFLPQCPWHIPLWKLRYAYWIWQTALLYAMTAGQSNYTVRYTTKSLL